MSDYPGWCGKLTYGRGRVNGKKRPIIGGMSLTRRDFVAAAVGSLTVFSRTIRGQQPYVDFAFSQYHNQTPASSLHKRLVEMWETVYEESNHRLVCKVFAQNNSIQGSDPAALKALVNN